MSTTAKQEREARAARERKRQENLENAIREGLKEQILVQMGSFMSGPIISDMDLYCLLELLIMAESGYGMADGLQYVLGLGNAGALFQDEPEVEIEVEPGDDEPFSGARLDNVIYADQAAADTSWITSTPKTHDYQIGCEDDEGEWQQVLSLTRAEYKKLKRYLGALRSLEASDTSTTAAA